MNRNMIQHLTPRSAGQRALRIALHAAALACVILGTFSYQAVQAQTAVLPQGGNVTSGQATINTRGNQMNITNTPGAVINWNSFNIGTGAGVSFQQQNPNSSVMNRVTGGNISTIYGNLSSNGRVILVNPAGLVIGAGAVVDTAGFVGSAMNATEANAQLDRLRFDSAGGAGRIQVDGVIRSPSGDIVLIAPDIGVGASALVQAPNGAVTLAAGQRVQLHGKGLDGITLELQAPSSSAINLGRLEGEAVGLFAGQLRHSGVIDTRHASIEGGRIVLRAADQLTVTGSITADGSANAQGGQGRGGNITLEGSKIAIQGATISASGPAGGGTVSIGGGWQGKDSGIRNASQTFVDQNSQINANATQNGNGGQVVIWSDGDTWYTGRIEARGGQLSGNGGQVEVSGKQRLGFQGLVNTGAANGRSGMLLLDPQDLEVINSAGVPTQTVNFSDPGSVFQVDPAFLQTVTGIILLQANRDITVTDAIVLSSVGGTHLQLEAGRNVNINNIINGALGQGNTVTVIANSSSTNVNPLQRGPGLGGINMATTGRIEVNSTGVVNLLVQRAPLNTTAGGITLTRVIAGTVVMAAGTGIQMNSTFDPADGIDANKIVLSSNTGDIGSIASPVVVRPALISSNEVALSVFAPSGNAIINGTRTVGPAEFTLRVAPGIDPWNPAITRGASVNGNLNITSTGPIFVGALAGESGSASINASTITLSSLSSPSGGQVQIAQANGNALNIQATQSFVISVLNSNLTRSIQIGGASSTGTLQVTAPSLTLNTNGAGAGIVVQEGNGPSSTTLAGNTISLVARGDVSVLGATVGLAASGGSLTRLESTQGNINIAGGNSASSFVRGGTVQLIAPDNDAGVITVKADGLGSAAVISGSGGVTVTAASALRVNSEDAAANQTSRIEANGGGNVNLSVPSIQITGGTTTNAKAEIVTIGAGSVNVNGSFMTLLTGSGSGAGAAIISSGSVSATMGASGQISIDGSDALNSSTGISAQNVNLNLGTLLISASDGSAISSTYGITASNVVTVSATNRIDVVGSIDGSSLNSAAVIYGGTGVDLTSTGGIAVTGGNGTSMVARIQSGGNLTLASAANLDVVGGLGNDVGAEIKAAGNINATVGVIRVDAGAANNSSTRIAALGNVNLSGTALNIFATTTPISSSTYGVSANGVVNVTTTSAPVTVLGPNSASTSTQAYIRGDQGVNLAVFPGANIEVRAGSGTNTNAVIQSNNNITLTGGPLRLIAGTGPSSSAIVTTTGNVTLSQAPEFTILSTAPANSQSHALIYAGSNSVTLATLYGTANTLNQVNAAGVATPAILIPAPDISTTVALPSNLPVGSTGTGTITFNNLSPYPTTVTVVYLVNGATFNIVTTVPALGVASVPIVITSTVSGGSLSANVTSVSALFGTTTLAESNTSNNAASGSFSALVVTTPVVSTTSTVSPLTADISTTLALPSGAALGSSVIGTYTFVNSGGAPTTFTYLVTINGVPTTQTLSLAPNASQVFTSTFVVGSIGAVVSINILNSTAPDTNAGNNNASGVLSAFITDIGSVINMPLSSAPAGSLVPVSYSFTNSSAFTTTFTPLVIVNGVSTPLAPLTLGPGQTIDGTQNVMIAGIALNVSIVAAASTFPEINLSNNTSNANINALLPNVVTSVAGPNTATIGSNAGVTVTYVNTGSAATQFTRTESINGVAQNNLISLNVGQSISFLVNAFVGTSGAVVSANAFSLYDSNPSDNNAIFNIAALAPSVISPPVVAPPIVTPPVITPPALIAVANTAALPLIQNNQLQQSVLLQRLVSSGSSVNTNNSGNTSSDTSGQVVSSREDIQVEGAPICRP